MARKTRRSNSPTAAGVPVSTDISRHGDRPGREFQELWFSLARLDWKSVVLVPVDAGVSAVLIANSLAEVARWLHEPPVTLFIMSDPLDYKSATARLGGPLVPLGEEQAGSQQGRAIIAVQSVLIEPLSLAVTREADASVLCIEKGRTRQAAVRRTVELIGRDRIAGCVLIH
jgi:hypothetical protein